MNRKRYGGWMACVVGLAAAGWAEPEGSGDAVISDNSFFIEEAYNQEPGVVQHIFTSANYFSPTRDLMNAFTQEWPFMSQVHQLSYTIPYVSLAGGTVSGLGDILLNYRYQWLSEDGRLALAPRVSPVLPTGDAGKGLGSASFGLQCNLPVSWRMSQQFVAHVNGGLTWLPNAKGSDALGNEVRAALVSLNGGASLIWLAGKAFNFMLEYAINHTASIDGTGVVVRSTEHLVSPGMRMAFDAGDLQIVPGVAVPFSWTSSGTSKTGVMIYLSFEHPF